MYVWVYMWMYGLCQKVDLDNAAEKKGPGINTVVTPPGTGIKTSRYLSVLPPSARQALLLYLLLFSVSILLL